MIRKILTFPLMCIGLVLGVTSMVIAYIAALLCATWGDR